MKGRARITIVSFSTMLALLLVLGAVLGQEKNGGSSEPYRPLAVLSEVLARIQSEYVEEPNFNLVTKGALLGLLESLDPASSYLTPEEYKEYQKKGKAEASPGIIASKRFGFMSVVATLPNSPAEKAGLQPGDMIESIDGRSTRDMSITEGNTRLEGAPGSLIKLSVVRERAAEPVPVEVKREAVRLPDIASRMLSSDIAYLRVTAFPKDQSQKIAARIRDLRRSGAANFILDLRGNALGEIEEGVATANLFLREGLISYVEGQQYPRQSFVAEPSKAISDEPLVVLVNDSTAGPAEIVAGAILDNHRGEVVGERTFGVGAIQKLIPLDDGSALILSVAKYFTPAGRKIPDSGVAPSVVVEDEREPAPLARAGEPPPAPAPPQQQEDAPLKRAIELLSNSAEQHKAA
ncbi:MAG: S41 family peptidase [Acidobacteria bacterium]|nr:S41 family peptidase [Acidobacteriota bacterium]